MPTKARKRTLETLAEMPVGRQLSYGQIAAAFEHTENVGFCGGNGIRDDDDLEDFDVLTDLFGGRFNYFVRVFTGTTVRKAVAVFGSDEDYADKDNSPYTLLWKAP